MSHSKEATPIKGGKKKTKVVSNVTHSPKEDSINRALIKPFKYDIPEGQLTLLVYPLYFVCLTNDPYIKRVIGEYTKRWIRYQMFKNPYNGSIEKSYVGTYAAATQSRSEVRYHINQLNSFLEHCSFMNVSSSKINRINKTIPLFEDKVNIDLKPGWAPRGEQADVIEYALKDDYPIKTLTIQTGQGKSATSLFINHHQQERFCLITRPQYLEKWVIDLKKMYEIEDDEILIVKGRKVLTELISALKEGRANHLKGILVSNRTYLSFIKEYEVLEQGIYETFGCTPEEFIPLLKVNTVYFDEGHQDSRIMFKTYIYTQAKKIVVMSATFDPDDPFLKKVTEVMYPKASRYQPKLSNQHTDAYRISYRFNYPRAIRCESRGNYSHMAFEKSIMRNKAVERNYYAMVAFYLRHQYLNSRKPGFKAIVFCFTVAMCTALRDYLREVFQEENLKIGRYTQEDSYDTLLESDIVITTLMSAGTGVDIPGLYVGIMTVALKSTQANIQTLGRLRKMPDGTTPKFFWFSNQDNPKHRLYDKEKFVIFKPITKSLGNFDYPESI